MQQLRFTLLLSLTASFSIAFAQSAFNPDLKIPFENSPNETFTYPALMDYYQALAEQYPTTMQWQTAGPTDSGEPLHVAVISKNGVFDPEKIRQSGRMILLINNGIHPGEPEGIDATALFLRSLLSDPNQQYLLDHLVIVVIPVYNVDGCLNRNSYSRANQNGPASYGFRGNARNYDLNRDFVKNDTRNAQSFTSIFRNWNPDVFIDTHTSNGADYQYTITLIATLHSKLEAPIGALLQNSMLPFLYQRMAEKSWDMTPYVDGRGETPDDGLIGFCDYGRYSTGYAALWNTIGFMPETHMLKPFKDRVLSTYAFLQTVAEYCNREHQAILKARAEAFAITRNKSVFSLEWQLDTTQIDSLQFKGFRAHFKDSEISGLPRLYYNRNEPYSKTIPYFNNYHSTQECTKPKAYLLPAAWNEVVGRLQRNGVYMIPLAHDTVVNTETYFVRNFETRNAWEGHYFHYRVQVETRSMERNFKKGDYYIPLDQDANRFIVETLEPQAPDSWFAWNFFDPILMQKEYFSDYVFEDLAAQFLKENPDLQKELEEMREKDPKFAASSGAQLDWVYRHSPWYEPSHRMYPVARILN